MTGDPLPRGPLAWFTAHEVAANLLMIFVLVAGAVSLSRITIEVFPEIPPGTITVGVPYLGASPEDTEEGICIKVEEAVAGIDGIKKIRSVAEEGFGSVVVEVQEDADAKRVLDDVKAAVDRITTFPIEAERPTVAETETRVQVISLVVFGDVPERTLKVVADRARDDLTAIDGISQVEVAGLRPYEISIEIPEERLRRYHLTLDQVAAIIRRSSLDLPGGSVKSKAGEILVRTEGQRYSGAEFGDLVVLSRDDGTRVRLADIATVVDGFEETDQAARFDGKSAGMVQVFRVGNEGALDVARKVKDYVEEELPSLPAGVEMATWEDRSLILRSRLDLLLRNGAIGLILVFTSLVMFLDVKLAFWTTMGIPISFLGAFYVIPHFGVTINMISLFAFIVSLGIVVDDAIVVGENVYSYLEKGESPVRAAILGVREMALPVTFSVLTTVAAFLPLEITEGRIGKIMRNIPVVVVAVLMISLTEALFILPAHLAHGRRGGKGVIFRAADALRRRCQAFLSGFVDGFYSGWLDRALRYRYLTMAIAISLLLLAGGYVAGGFIKFTFMPQVDADNMAAAVTMLEGTPIEQTEEAVARLEKAAERVRERVDETRPGEPSVIDHIASTIGDQPFSSGRGHPGSRRTRTGANIAEVNVALLSSEVRKASSGRIEKLWREEAGRIPGTKTLAFQATLFTAGDDVSVELGHPDFEKLQLAVAKLKERLAAYGGVRDITDSFIEGKRELKLRLNPVGRAGGLSLLDLGRQVRGAFYGVEAERIQRGRDDVRVMVRYPRSARRSLADLRNMRIRIPSGQELPFETIANAKMGRGYAEIYRSNRRRVVTVKADVDEREANADEINRDLTGRILPKLQREIPGLSFSFEGAEKERRDTMASLWENFLLALIAIFALLAIPFRSYTQPLIVMSAIPFGMFGAVLGHVLMGMDLSLLSMFGVVALTGVVVNDSLIMVDLINRQRRTGVPLGKAVRQAGVRRFRPIMLTTLTTFLGLSPMILERSLQARFLIPMAISLGFGVVMATAITLVLVPCLYLVLEDIHALVGSEPVPAGAEA